MRCRVVRVAGGRFSKRRRSATHRDVAIPNSDHGAPTLGRPIANVARVSSVTRAVIEFGATSAARR